MAAWSAIIRGCVLLVQLQHIFITNDAATPAPIIDALQLANEINTCIIPPCIDPCQAYNSWFQAIGVYPYCSGYYNTLCRIGQECNRQCYAIYTDGNTGEIIANCDLRYPFFEPVTPAPVIPTPRPTALPSSAPIPAPTLQPSVEPSEAPSGSPTTPHPTTTANPSNAPSTHPSIAPSSSPSNTPSSFPSNIPSSSPIVTTSIPTPQPVTVHPTAEIRLSRPPIPSPPINPSSQTNRTSTIANPPPSAIRTTQYTYTTGTAVPPSLASSPSDAPTPIPTPNPTANPTMPTVTPSAFPSTAPSAITSTPSSFPTYAPSSAPTLSTTTTTTSPRPLCPLPGEACTSAVADATQRCCTETQGSSPTRVAAVCLYDGVDASGYQIGTCCVRSGRPGCNVDADCCTSDRICYQGWCLRPGHAALLDPNWTGLSAASQAFEQRDDKKFEFGAVNVAGKRAEGTFAQYFSFGSATNMAIWIGLVLLWLAVCMVFVCWIRRQRSKWRRDAMEDDDEDELPHDAYDEEIAQMAVHMAIAAAEGVHDNHQMAQLMVAK